MKLPFILSGSGGYHNYNESPFDGDDIDIESIDELGTDTTETDFAEYLWMENEEEFDKIEWQRLEEEELMKQCMENMLEDGYDSDDSMDSDGWSSQLEYEFLVFLFLTFAKLKYKN